MQAQKRCLCSPGGIRDQADKVAWIRWSVGSLGEDEDEDDKESGSDTTSKGSTDFQESTVLHNFSLLIINGRCPQMHQSAKLSPVAFPKTMQATLAGQKPFSAQPPSKAQHGTANNSRGSSKYMLNTQPVPATPTWCLIRIIYFLEQSGGRQCYCHNLRVKPRPQPWGPCAFTCLLQGLHGGEKANHSLPL